MEIIAYFDSSHDMPVEILAAAGFVPRKILGSVHESTAPADQFLSNFFCPAARSWLTEALAHSGEWAGIVFAHGCDATNRHFDVWKRHVRTPFLHWFNSPIKDDERARAFYLNELGLLIDRLGEQTGARITTESLRSAIAASNRVKLLLRRLSALRSEKDIPNRDYFTVLARCVQSPAPEMASFLEETAGAWEKRPPFPAGKRRFLLTGSDVTYVEWMDLLDEAGIRVVRDDLSIGERMFATGIPEGEDPLGSIADYYLRIPKPATKISLAKRIDFLLSALGETPIDAVLSQNLKFCEPYAYDAVPVNNELKARGYQLIHIERDFTPLLDQQAMNRLQAFTEML